MACSTRAESDLIVSSMKIHIHDAKSMMQTSIRGKQPEILRSYGICEP